MHSAEMRWFFPGRVPEDVRTWFERGRAVPVEPARTDRYLAFPECDSVGVKIREGRLEIKANVAGPTLRAVNRHVEGWSDSWLKWSAGSGDPPFPLAPALEHLMRHGTWIPVVKERRLRRWSAEGDALVEIVPGGPAAWPASGCLVELTGLRAGDDGDPWFTLGFEAFGERDAVEGILSEALHAFFADHGAPPGLPLTEEESDSYPAWLDSLAGGE